MTAYSGNSLKAGVKILLNNDPCEIQFSEFIKPGKGQAFVRIKLKQLLTGKLLNKTVKATDIFYSTNVIEINAVYLYTNQSVWVFMNQENFEHIHVSHKFLFSSEKWLTNLSKCRITLWNNSPIAVHIDNFVHLQVQETDIVVKGDTINSSTKLVTVETGAIVRVPLFIKKGDTIKIDTRNGKYISRVTS
ncbi:Elongation factor P [Buchnera aphidicola (Cinara kochiana kochiana)]|uniref:Elongation factor P n=1 Tax=Buchnera aphidicola (Cinara kochiana kochiana) TaxID=2518976 RepID=A0A451D526_9GAMM|nr:elongation factor P [Buchnera aphidicola]VFP80939.1 Elongation factor P [Buchnera aphidicola (Cinara kochiana kochiana)]